MNPHRPALLLGAASLLGCQAILGLDEGKDTHAPSTSSTSSTSSSSSSSSSGTGAGGSGGAGGATTSTTTTTGVGGSGGVGGAGGAGGAITGTGGGTTTGTGGAGGAITGTGGMGGATTTTTTGAGGAGGAAPSCSDGEKNGDETDIDCGGSCATPCGNGKGCNLPIDCQSKVCTAMICQAPSCGDGVKNGNETDLDCGGGCPLGCALGKACSQNVDCQTGDCFAGACGAVLLLAGGNAASVLAGELRPNGSWTITSLLDATSFAPALAITSQSEGVGLIRANGTGDLRAVTWSAGQWGAFNNVGPAITTREQPSLGAAGLGARAAFHGDNFKHYFAAWNGSIWSVQAETIGLGADQSAGPSPPVLTSSPSFPAGAEATVAFIANAVNKPFARNRVGGAWDAAQQVDGGVTNFNLAPELVALGAGPELLMVWMRNDNQVLHATRSNGVWSASAPVPNAFTAARVSLAALPGGAAILAFQGTDNFLYYSLYTAGTWGAVLPFSAPNVAIAGSPAVTRGVGGATAEIAFAKSADNIVYHARFIGMSWTQPVVVGGSNMSRVAIASAP